MKNIFDISEFVIVVTGSSGNLGEYYCKNLVELGATVLGLDKVVPSEKFLNELENRNNFHFFEVDLVKKAELVALCKKILKNYGYPQVLINNAAIDSPPNAPANENGPFEGYQESSWDKVMEVNLKSMFFCCQELGGMMAKSGGGGSIINIGSIYGTVSPDQQLYQYRRDRGEEFYKPVAYSVSKSGVLNLTRYLAVYWAKQNVRVNSLTIAGVYAGQDTEFLNNYCDRIPVGRMAEAQDYIGALVFLSSKASSYMTGANMVIDGGWTAI
jgi:NAD(P)-dependent dehydrogenase (short-subunit alcohol dehydrogenase family)